MPEPDPNPPAGEPVLNNQIVEAVETSTQYALGFASLGQQDTVAKNRISAGGAIAYDKAAQAAALAMQDAADYQRNVMSISTVVQGKAMAEILASPVPRDTAIMAFAMALVASLAAPITAGVASAVITHSLTEFPKA